jgi:hypothetical protein
MSADIATQVRLRTYTKDSRTSDRSEMVFQHNVPDSGAERHPEGYCRRSHNAHEGWETQIDTFKEVGGEAARTQRQATEFLGLTAWRRMWLRQGFPYEPDRN